MDEKQNHAGMVLKAAREKAGMSLRAIADETCVSLAFLTAIENADHDALPAPAFVKGFIKSYALAVGVEPQAALELYKRSDVFPLEQASDKSDAAPHIQFADHRSGNIPAAALAAPSTFSRRSIVSAYGIAAALGLVVTVTLMINMIGQSNQPDGLRQQTLHVAQNMVDAELPQRTDQRRDDKKLPKQDEVLPADVTKVEKDTVHTEKMAVHDQGKAQKGMMQDGQPTGFLPSVQASSPATTKITPQTYTLVAVEDGWLQIHGQGGDLLFEGMLIAGQKKVLPLQAAGVTTGNAGAFELILGDKNLGVLGARGAVEQNLPLGQL